VVEGEEGEKSASGRVRDKADVLDAISQCPCDSAGSVSDGGVAREGLGVSMLKGVINDELGEGHKAEAWKKLNPLLRRGGSMSGVMGRKWVDSDASAST